MVKTGVLAFLSAVELKREVIGKMKELLLLKEYVASHLKVKAIGMRSRNMFYCRKTMKG